MQTKCVCGGGGVTDVSLHAFPIQTYRVVALQPKGRVQLLLQGDHGRDVALLPAKTLVEHDSQLEGQFEQIVEAGDYGSITIHFVEG
jgi:hypothetical protein